MHKYRIVGGGGWMAFLVCECTVEYSFLAHGDVFETQDVSTYLR